jgi:GMP synthase-like glutamine amidotransferase
LQDKGNSDGDPFTGTWFQWHYDRFDVPPTAVRLATGPVSDQAFMTGRTLGLQFHPAVTESIVAHWSRGGGATELVGVGIDRDELLSRTREMVESTIPRTDRLVQWVLDTAATSAAPAQAHETQR